MMRLATLLCSTWLCASAAFAEQFAKFGDYEVHYVVINSTFITPEVAARLGLTRSNTTALVNLSVLEHGTDPVPAGVTGKATNLLGTKRSLEFREIHEGDARYYLAALRFSEEEMWRFAIELALPDGKHATLRFEQKLYRR